MSGTLQKVCAGERLVIPAQTWNTVRDATEDYLRRHRRGDVGAGRALITPASSAIAMIKNPSGTDMDRVNVLLKSACPEP